MHINRHSLIIAVILLLSIGVVRAQESPEKIVNDFFKIYKDDPVKAVEFAFETNKWMKSRGTDETDNLRNQLQYLTNNIGDYNGYEKITEKGIGESYKLHCYWVKYDRQPIRFTFIFYRVNDKWQVQNFKFDVDYNSELQEAAAIYYLDENH